MANVIDLPVKNPYSRAVEILAAAPPAEFRATVALVLTELCEKIDLLQGHVFLLSTAVYGERLTPDQRRVLAQQLDVEE